MPPNRGGAHDAKGVRGVGLGVKGVSDSVSENSGNIGDFHSTENPVPVFSAVTHRYSIVYTKIQMSGLFLNQLTS